MNARISGSGAAQGGGARIVPARVTMISDPVVSMTREILEFNHAELQTVF
jgi:hypothetical protein